MHLIIQYTIALANLYGIFDKALLLDIYNRQNKANMTQDELAAHFKQEAFILKKADIVLRGSEIIKAEIIDKKYYDVLKRYKAGKDYYIPERDILLKYQADNFIEPSAQYEALKAFLKNRLPDALPNKIDETAQQIAVLCRDGWDVQKIFDCLMQAGIYYNENFDMDITLKTITDMYNASRIWDNNGFKPNELSPKDFFNSNISRLSYEGSEIYEESEMLDDLESKITSELMTALATFEANQKYVSKGLPSTQLNVQLAARTVAQLREIADYITLSGVSTLRKMPLVEKVAEGLVEDWGVVLFDLLLDFEAFEMALIKKALKSDYIKVDEELLYLEQRLLPYGYAQVTFDGEYYYYAIAEEIKPNIKAILYSKDFRYRYYARRTKYLLDTIVFIYGIIKIDDAVRLIQGIEKELTATKTLRIVVEAVAKLKESCELVNDYIVFSEISAFYDDDISTKDRAVFVDTVKKYSANYDNIPLAKLTGIDIIWHQMNDDIAMTEPLAKIKELLEERLSDLIKDDEERADYLYELVYVINFAAKQAMPLTITHNMLRTVGMKPEEFQNFDQLYIEHVEQARLWLIKGHTKNSLEELGFNFAKYVPTVNDGPILRGPKVGRNDPCPCGSGKKYKKCCLKLQRH